MDNVETAVTLIVYLTAQAAVLIWRLSSHDTALKSLTAAIEKLEKSMRDTERATVEARITNSILKNRVDSIERREEARGGR